MLTLEPLTRQNAPDFGFVHATAWHETYSGIIPDAYLSRITPENRARRFAAELDWSPEEFYLARSDGAAAGILILSVSAAAREGEVQAVYLLQTFQGRGYGRKLMDFAAGRLQERGCTRLVLWVLEQNERSRAFYEHMGLAPDGERRQLDFGAPLWALRYAKPLPGAHEQGTNI